MCGNMAERLFILIQSRLYKEGVGNADVIAFEVLEVYCADS